MKNIKKLLTILLTTVMVGCCPCKHFIPSTNTVVRDSICYIEKVDTVFVKLDQEHYETIQQKYSHLETKYAVSDASIDSLGLLHHSLSNKKVDIGVQVVEKEKYVVKDSIVRVEVPVEVIKTKTKYPNSYWILLSIVILLVGWRIYKLVRVFV